MQHKIVRFFWQLPVVISPPTGLYWGDWQLCDCSFHFAYCHQFPVSQLVNYCLCHVVKACGGISDPWVMSPISFSGAALSDTQLQSTTDHLPENPYAYTPLQMMIDMWLHLYVCVMGACRKNGAMSSRSRGVCAVITTGRVQEAGPLGH